MKSFSFEYRERHKRVAVSGFDEDGNPHIIADIHYPFEDDILIVFEYYTAFRLSFLKKLEQEFNEWKHQYLRIQEAEEIKKRGSTEEHI